MQEVRPAVEEAFRQESGRVLATLIRVIGDFELAEDSMQDAFALAMDKWSSEGVPANAGAWITTAARNKAIDRLRRESKRGDKEAVYERLMDDNALDVRREEHDDRLKLIFTCCHPSLAVDAQVALTLRTLGGLSTREIARAFLVSEPTLAQRLVRVKRKIKKAGIPYRVPSDHLLPERLVAVLYVVYLIFNEGYTATEDSSLVRTDMCDEAIRLGRMLVALMPDEPEAMGLLSLMLLQDSRRNARVDADGRLVLLEDQDRALWDRDKKLEGLELLDRSLRRRRPGLYQLQAAIAALHARAATAGETDWTEIAELYSELVHIHPTPVVELNRAVAVAMARGPGEGLAIVERLLGEGRLSDYHLLHSTHADLLKRSGRSVEATVAYRKALDLARQPSERAFLEERLTELGEAR